jgi:hypothetical protein
LDAAVQSIAKTSKYPVLHTTYSSKQWFLFNHLQELLANNLVFGLIEFQNINQLASGIPALNLILKTPSRKPQD